MIIRAYLPAAVVLVCSLATAGAPNTRATNSIRKAPINVETKESARYIFQGAPEWAIDKTSKTTPPSEGVLRTLSIRITNTSQQELSLDVEFAMYQKDSSGKVSVVKMRGVQPKKGSKELPKKGKATITVGAGQMKVLTIEGWLPGELGALHRGKDQGIAVFRPGDPNDPTRHDRWHRYTEAPTPPRSKPHDLVSAEKSVALPMPPHYYGYSVAIYQGGDLIYKADKNPDNIPNFGITATGK